MVKPVELSKRAGGQWAAAVSEELSRRHFLGRCAAGLAGVTILGSAGCRSQQTAQVLKPGDKGFVGTHSAGSETFSPLVDGAVANLLARHQQGVQPAGFTQGAQPGAMKICFVGVENKSVEEMGDFKEQIYQQIDSKILQSQLYTSISRRLRRAGPAAVPPAARRPAHAAKHAGLLGQHGADGPAFRLPALRHVDLRHHAAERQLPAQLPADLGDGQHP